MADDAIARARKIRLIAFDVDGVMTDGTLFLADDGQEYKGFNSLDGHGLKMLQRSGVALAIITGRTSRVVEHRARNLGIDIVHQGAHDKLVVYQALCRELAIDPEATAYMGDDVVDLPVMRRAGLAITVPAAPELVKAHSHYTTRREAGRGAVREACEFLMRAQGTLDAALAPYLQ
ncbi:Phosphatase kdsC [Thiobacillus denitrificans ATCC 25259]|uniref:3-deoxy-D-manno-octulosonate 8-phosphate phosphatase KdsC n=1 Tax=Thiobacillus denitrificans (strain ATCC 25259 / T1) TaxID=292415 RepID=Q3SLC5_THIDA|nr:HAD-IIIA family hydrolase [Thiobacillus denitrificans]AAZ96490.1 Phosphatase kdsC [Thiobacillus denitrificans ATCC 25259]